MIIRLERAESGSDFYYSSTFADGMRELQGVDIPLLVVNEGTKDGLHYIRIETYYNEHLRLPEELRYTVFDYDKGIRAPYKFLTGMIRFMLNQFCHVDLILEGSSLRRVKELTF